MDNKNITSNNDNVVSSSRLHQLTCMLGMTLLFSSVNVFGSLKTSDAEQNTDPNSSMRYVIINTTSDSDQSNYYSQIKDLVDNKDSDKQKYTDIFYQIQNTQDLKTVVEQIINYIEETFQLEFTIEDSSITYSDESFNFLESLYSSIATVIDQQIKKHLQFNELNDILTITFLIKDTINQETKQQLADICCATLQQIYKIDPDFTNLDMEHLFYVIERFCYDNCEIIINDTNNPILTQFAVAIIKKFANDVDENTENKLSYVILFGGALRFLQVNNPTQLDDIILKYKSTIDFIFKILIDNVDLDNFEYILASGLLGQTFQDYVDNKHEHFKYIKQHLDVFFKRLDEYQESHDSILGIHFEKPSSNDEFPSDSESSSEH